MVAGTVSGLSSGGTDVFSDISTVVGSSAGSTTFRAGSGGGFTFTGQGSDNTLDLSSAPSGTSISVNGDSSTSPGTVTGLSPGLGGSMSDSFAGIQTFTGFAGRAITSVNNVTASAGSNFSFTVTTVGTPLPSIAKKGKLPKSVSFHDNNNGTATISGTPAAKSPGTYRLTVKATFGKGKTKHVVNQAFTLTVT